MSITQLLVYKTFSFVFRFSVRVGDYNYTENNCTDDERDCAPQNLDIEDVITFADLMYGIEETDISLIRLKTPIIFTREYNSYKFSPTYNIHKL